MTSSALVPFQVKREDILSNKSTQYLVLDFIGEGCFGKVAKCVNLKTSETTAIKIHKDLCDHYEEVNMLETLRTLDPVKNNLLEYNDSFVFEGMPCVSFEMLDKSLWDFVLERRAPLTLCEIRPIARQLIVAFQALKSVGIMHTDLKPDNVMLVNQEDEPFKVKLIDFGLAMPVSKVKRGMLMQPVGYRAPEVDLGLPICEAIDMWGLGCTLAFLFFGRNMFCGQSTYDTMKTACCLLGQPEDHVLDAGRNTWQFFKKEQCSPYYHTWRLKTPKEHRDATGVWPQTAEWCFDTVGSLDEAIKLQSNPKDFIECEDTKAFSHLLEWLLSPDSEMRLTPEQALRHDFITMCHLTDHMGTSVYVQDAYELMIVSPPYDTEEDDSCLSDLLSHMESIIRDGFSKTHCSGYEDTDLRVPSVLDLRAPSVPDLRVPSGPDPRVPFGPDPRVPSVFCDPPTPRKPFQVQKQGFDAEMRVTRHSFVTPMCHLTDHMDFSAYVQAAYDLMTVSPPDDPFSPGGPGYKGYVN